MIKSFPAELNKLYEMLDFIRYEADVAGFDSCYVNKIELATEEVLVNIISYGYPEKLGQIAIQCSHTPNSDLEITIKDEGIPYNPLKNETKCSAQASLEERTVGGYGIFFILNLMDEVAYKREENVNVLILRKFQPT
jgi:serine/threonine-protein kinase RsbW